MPLLIVALLACGTASRSDTDARATADAAAAAPARRAAEEAAASAAERWLSLVDAGRYAESWQAAAALFRQAIDARAWEQAVVQARAPLEPFGTRRLVSATYTTSVPGGPSGQYVVLVYETAIAGDRLVRETVTPTLERGGEWRVSGYFVRPL